MSLVACSNPPPRNVEASPDVELGASRPARVVIDSVLIGVTVASSPRRDAVQFRVSFRNLKQREIPLNLSYPYPVVVNVTDEKGNLIWTNVAGSAVQDMLEVGQKLRAGGERVIDVTWPLNSTTRIPSASDRFTTLIEADISRSIIQLGPVPLKFEGTS